MTANNALNQVMDNTLVGAPLTGKQIQEALSDPNSALSKDLENARMSAIARKINREHIELNLSFEQSRKVAIERLEDELLAYRNKSAAEYRENIEKYYAERNALAQKEAALSTNSEQVLFHASLNQLSQATQELCITQSMLVSIENERDPLLKSYAENQTNCANQFVESLKSKTKYIVDNVEYCLDTAQLTFEQLEGAMSADQRNQIPKGKEQQYLEQRKKMLEQKQQETANTLSKQKPFTEVIMSLPEENDVRQLFEKGMIDNRPLLQRNVLIEIALTNFVRAYLCEIIAESSAEQAKQNARQVNRTSSHIVRHKFNELKPLYDRSQELDVKLHINCKNKLKLLERQAVLQLQINEILKSLQENDLIIHSPDKKNFVNNIKTLNNFHNNRRELTPTFGPR